MSRGRREKPFVRRGSGHRAQTSGGTAARVLGVEAGTAQAVVDLVTMALEEAPNGLTVTELMALVRKGGLRIDGEDLGRLLRSPRANRVVQVSVFPERYALRRVPGNVRRSSLVDAWQQAHDELVHGRTRPFVAGTDHTSERNEVLYASFGKEA